MAKFRSGSRYTNGIFTLNPENQEFMILRENINIPETSQDVFLIVTGEHIKRPDSIAEQTYGSPELWWVIMDINNIREPLFDLEVGQELRIPPLAIILDAIEKINLGG